MKLNILAFYPKFYRKWLKKNLEYADISLNLQRFLKIRLLNSIFISLAISILVGAFLKVGINYLILIFAFIFIVLHFFFDLIVLFIADRRGKAAEEILPDALQLIAGNIRSGLTPDRAILMAARPEFGVLEKEIKNAGRKALSGSSLEDALLEMGKRIKSRIVKRTFLLISEGLRKGGALADLLEHTAEDLRTLKTLRREIAAQVAMYAIFIFIAIGFAAPVLFSFSSYLVETMSEMGSKLKLEEAVSYGKVYGLRLGVVKISASFLRFYSFLAMVILSFFGSLLIGLLKSGRELDGFKYFPVLLTISFLLLRVSDFLVRSISKMLVPS